jgi:hypothetical protein
MSQYLESPIIFDNKYGFLKDNNNFMNNLINTFYKDNEEYQRFK